MKTNSSGEISYEDKIRLSSEYALQESSAHFDHTNAVYRALQRLIARLNAAQIPYALGALALNAHGYARMTTDINIAMTREGLEKFRAQLLGLGYRPAFEGAYKTFRDIEDQAKIDVRITGGLPGDGKPKPVTFPDPQDAIILNSIRLVTVKKVLELKLASGMTASHRLKDLADAQETIPALNLPLDFGSRLDPSVRGEYERLWHTVNDTVDIYDEEQVLKRKGARDGSPT